MSTVEMGIAAGRECYRLLTRAYTFPHLLETVTDGRRASEDALDEFKRVAGNATTKVPGNEPVGGQRVLRVDVGKDDEHVFSPNEVRDQPAGTTIQFHFHPKVSSGDRKHMFLIPAYPERSFRHRIC